MSLDSSGRDPPPRSLPGDLDLALAIGATAVLLGLILIVSWAPLRIALGLTVVLFLPGYCLLAALYPRKGDLAGIERLALSLGLSLALVPLVGLVLNYTPWGIRLTPIAVGLSALILVLSGVAAYRRRQFPVQERYAGEVQLPVAPVLRAWGAGRGWDRLLNIALALAILGALGSLAYAIAQPKVGERFTEFYVLGPTGEARDYPAQLWAGIPVQLTVGIVNQEFQEETYRVEATLAGEKVGEAGPIVLGHGQKWEEPVSLLPQHTGAGQEMEILLYRGSGGEPYRKLRLWVEVRSLG